MIGRLGLVMVTRATPRKSPPNPANLLTNKVRSAIRVGAMAAIGQLKSANCWNRYQKAADSEHLYT
jgi:hypothetical protein